MLTHANKLTKIKPFPCLQTLNPSEGLRLDEAQALIQRSSPPTPGNRHSGAAGNRALEMLAALPLGFLTTGGFKDRAQSTKQAPKCLGNSIWQPKLDKYHRNDLA